jgi:hypothetical protein
MSDSEKRPRGLLTPTDRAFLRGEIEYDHKQQVTDRYRGIRNRIANGLLDFTAIQHLLREKERKRIFRDPSDAAGVEDPAFFENLHSMFYWTYFGLKEQNYDFQGLLTEVVEQAEEDFARKYWGESVDVSVQFNVDITRSHDIEEVISAVENGGPVKANSLYDLLELSGGVPIDTSKLGSVRVWFQSSYPEGEKAVLETLFSAYLDTEVEIVDAESRVELAASDMKGGKGFEKTSAVVSKDQSRPDPGQIKNYRPTNEYDSEETTEYIRKKEILRPTGDDQANSQSEVGEFLDDVVDDIGGDEESVQPSIHELIDQRDTKSRRDRPISPDKISELLRNISDRFVSTSEIAAAVDCTPDAARQALSTLRAGRQVNHRSVVDSKGGRAEIWWLSEEPVSE